MWEMCLSHFASDLTKSVWHSVCWKLHRRPPTHFPRDEGTTHKAALSQKKRKRKKHIVIPKRRKEESQKEGEAQGFMAQDDTIRYRYTTLEIKKSKTKEESIDSAFLHNRFASELWKCARSNGILLTHSHTSALVSQRSPINLSRKKDFLSPFHRPQGGGGGGRERG